MVVIIKINCVYDVEQNKNQNDDDQNGSDYNTSKNQNIPKQLIT